MKLLRILVVPSALLALSLLVLSLSTAVAASPDPAQLSPLNHVYIPVVANGHTANALVIDARTRVKSQGDASPESVEYQGEPGVDVVSLHSIGAPPQIPSLE